MKRTAVGACGVTLVALLGAWSLGRVTARGEPAAPPGHTGFININMALKNFEKANAQGVELMALAKKHADKMNPLSMQVEQVRKELADETGDLARDRLTKKLKELETELQQLDAKARKDVGDEQSRLGKIIHQDITAEVAQLAKERGFEAVFIYPASMQVDKGGPKPGDVFRILAAPAAYPLYIRPDLDLTDVLIERLNKKHPVKAPK
jgi:Skp family chaperone for outer membrane proteins